MYDLNKRTIDAVMEVSRIFGKPEAAKELLPEILAILKTTLGYNHGTITLVDEESGDLLVEAAHGVPPGAWKEVRYRKGEGITGIILESGNPLAIPALKNDPRFLNRLSAYDPEASFLGVPIHAGKRICGVFTFSIEKGERYRLDDHLRIAALFSNLIGGVLARLFSAEKEKEVIIREKDKLQGQLKGTYRPDNMVGVSKVMQDIFEGMEQVAKWSTTVLIRGESGTGKELVAKGIHFNSPRAAGPFVKLNCAALPETLLESELFGHEKGAFTGANFRKPGRFELAHKGTLFLDEIGDASMALQAKLLRVLQEGQFERLGGTETLKVDVRLIAATNVDLEKAVSEKRFREDFYYRLNVMPVYLPPLRERREDVPYLVDHFLEKFSKDIGERLTATPDALHILQSCDWPGNVRELENCVHRAAVTCRNLTIRPADLPCNRGQCTSRLIHGATPVPEPMAVADLSAIEDERERVITALKRSGWVQAKAARLLRMSPRQIGYRIKTLGIEMERL